MWAWGIIDIFSVWAFVNYWCMALAYGRIMVLLYYGMAGLLVYVIVDRVVLPYCVMGACLWGLCEIWLHCILELWYWVVLWYSGIMGQGLGLYGIVVCWYSEFMAS